jgi:uncharacterized delta-60 repeat protein
MIKKLLVLVILLLGSIPAFSQTVDTAWVRRYNGPGNDYDRARAIAIDAFGNVYVTGWSSDTLTFLDYATIKYSSNGDTAWVRRYNGPENGSDRAYAIAVDDSGNVYVTGYSYDSITWKDYATIKYDSNGNELWMKRYDGGAGDDQATSIKVDGSGNVYVTGGSGFDYATIKYSPKGDTAWVRRYCGPVWGCFAVDIAVDRSGNAYVTGISDSMKQDYATIKYDPNGNELWVARYNGPGNGDDNARAVAIDSSGNVYVTGYSYDSTTSKDYATIKYDSNGNELWVRRYNGPGNSDDDARAVAIDSWGNVYITGWSYGSGTYFDYATIKYYTNGGTAWIRTYNGTGNSDDYATALNIDAYGNVYVTGESRGSGTDYDYTTIKYDPDGNQLWEKKYNGPGDSSDYAYAITVDGSGNAYVTGESWGSGTGYDYATIKYSKKNEVKDETGNREKPSEFALSQNYPNPFNQSTKIEFTLSHSGFVSLNIYDLLGRKIRALVSENLSSGYKSVFWDGKDDSGKVIASGIYFYQLKIGDFSEGKRLVLLK